MKDQAFPSKASRVFEPFFRVDPARRKSGTGAGLGPAIAKEIVERYGGKLMLQNRSPKGLRQRIIFQHILPDKDHELDWLGASRSYAECSCQLRCAAPQALRIFSDA
jgi:signal transduction histidine kinase